MWFPWWENFVLNTISNCAFCATRRKAGTRISPSSNSSHAWGLSCNGEQKTAGTPKKGGHLAVVSGLTMPLLLWTKRPLPFHAPHTGVCCWIGEDNLVDWAACTEMKGQRFKRWWKCLRTLCQWQFLLIPIPHSFLCRLMSCHARKDDLFHFIFPQLHFNFWRVFMLHFLGRSMANEWAVWHAPVVCFQTFLGKESPFIMFVFSFVVEGNTERFVSIVVASCWPEEQSSVAVTHWKHEFQASPQDPWLDVFTLFDNLRQVALGCC